MKTLGIEDHFMIPELFGESDSTRNVAAPARYTVQHTFGGAES
jgi:hypothetical protein